MFVYVGFFCVCICVCMVWVLFLLLVYSFCFNLVVFSLFIHFLKKERERGSMVGRVGR